MEERRAAHAERMVATLIGTGDEAVDRDRDGFHAKFRRG
jgi:hypothetical protein